MCLFDVPNNFFFTEDNFNLGLLDKTQDTYLILCFI